MIHTDRFVEDLPATDMRTTVDGMTLLYDENGRFSRLDLLIDLSVIAEFISEEMMNNWSPVIPVQCRAPSKCNIIGLPDSMRTPVLMSRLQEIVDKAFNIEAFFQYGKE
jgi:hypothetical protein